MRRKNWWLKYYLRAGWTEWEGPGEPDPTIYLIERIDEGIKSYNPGDGTTWLFLEMLVILGVPGVLLLWLSIVSWQLVMLAYFMVIGYVLWSVAQR